MPSSPPAGYSGTPLPKKLGIKSGSVVALVNAPPGFERVLGELPPGATLKRQARGRRDLTIWFVRSHMELTAGIKRMASRGEKSGLWIAWAKRTSRLAGDFGEGEVRANGLAAGLVDFKVCAIDGDWSGLRFSQRASR